MNDSTRRLLRERLSAKATQLYALVDTLDVKAGVLLATTAFLFGQSVNHLLLGTGFCTKTAAWLALVSLLFAGWSAFAVLLVRNVPIEPSENWKGWLNGLEQAHPSCEVESLFVEGLIADAEERICATSSIIDRKGKLLLRTYAFAAAGAMFTVLSTLGRLT